jgi:hypothetical protein
MVNSNLINLNIYILINFEKKKYHIIFTSLYFSKKLQSFKNCTIGIVQTEFFF